MLDGFDASFAAFGRYFSAIRNLHEIFAVIL